MLKNVESPATTINRQTALIPAKDKGSEVMNIGQLNEYLCSRSAVICEYVRKKRRGFHTSGIFPPICFNGTTLQENIDNVLECFKRTLSAALSSEARYIQALENFEALSSIVETEKYLIFDFLSENGLAGKFNEFVKLQKGGV